MPLPKPTLDNRRFDQLVGEGRALIPRLAPRWTNHNASDPGITLLELGAWLTEQNIFRFDRLSEEASRAFVRLVGIEPRAPGVAHTVVSVTNSNAAGLDLPPRMQLGTPQVPLFETTEPLFASPASLASVWTRKDAFVDVSELNATLSGFAAFGSRPRTGHALYLGFDRALDASAKTLSLYVWTRDWIADEQTRAALIAEYESLKSQHPACLPADWRRHYRAHTVWEYLAADNTWQPLLDVVDETRALTLSGFVRFSAPATHKAGGPDGKFPIRCRIARGRFECPPALLHVAFNAVNCEHALSVADHRIATSRGHAGAVYSLGAAPVVAGSVALRLDDGAGGVQTDWVEDADFDRAGAHDRVFVLDSERGEIHSGNGLRAQIIPAGFDVWTAFRMGGGEDGNVPEHTLMSVPPNAANVALFPGLSALATPLAIEQHFAAIGGAARELLASAQARAFDLVTSVDKAVTLADVERLALATPGVPVARVRAVANHEPHLPCYPAPGTITLIVIPPCPKPAPLPSRALLDAVERYLEPRRLITSKIRAIAPHYRRVGVNATLHLSCEADGEQVLQLARARLDAFFDPLEGGPDGSGWRFGRTVYRSEVMALLADVPGIARVTALTLSDPYDDAGSAGCCGSSNRPGGGRCDNIELCPHELVMPGRHRLTVESDIARNLRRSDAHECESA